MSCNQRWRRAGGVMGALVMGALAASAILSPAVAQGGGFAPGSKVQAAPNQIDAGWQECVVVEGPIANGYYRLNCAADPARDQLIMSVPPKWMRPAGGAQAPAPAPTPMPPAAASPPQQANAPPPAGGRFAPGSTVIASPNQIDTANSWRRCTVLSGPGANGYYDLQCQNRQVLNGVATVTMTREPALAQWMKPDDPSFQPGPPPAAPAAPRANPPPQQAAAPPAAGDAAQVAAGNYQCTANNRANLGMAFTVTGPGQYRASDGSMGTFQYDGASRGIVFTGYLASMHNRGTTAMYYTPKGIPTVSFRRDGEIAFCEKV